MPILALYLMSARLNDNEIFGARVLVKKILMPISVVVLLLLLLLLISFILMFTVSSTKSISNGVYGLIIGCLILQVVFIIRSRISR